MEHIQQYSTAKESSEQRESHFRDEYLPRSLRSIYQHQRKYELTDFFMILGVFLFGVIVAVVMSNYFRIKKEKIEEINKQFKGLQGEFEQGQKKLQKLVYWRYKFKFIEKCYYVLLCFLSLVLYKSNYFFNLLLIQYPHVSVTFFSALIILFHVLSNYMESKHMNELKRVKKLKQNLKDAKRMLLSHLDPIVVDTLKDIVKKDMKAEHEEIRLSDKGCIKLCKLANESLRIDLERHQKLISPIIQFRWCDDCSKKQPGAVNICNSRCGQKFYSQCASLMKDFGRKAKIINQLKEQLQEEQLRSKKFLEYQKAKRDLEYQDYRRSQSQFIEDFNRLDSNNSQEQARKDIIEEKEDVVSEDLDKLEGKQ